jgi:NTE family protein
MRDTDLHQDVRSPVERIEVDPKEYKLDDGIALCLSGGGYRAMLFHAGSLLRLYELGILGEVKRISSVSGGSITAGVLGKNWSKLSLDPILPDDFLALIVNPIRALASKTIDRSSIIGGTLLLGAASDRIANAYRKHLFGDSTLQNLPDAPRFVINATNVQSGALWRFMKPYMRDYRVGEVKNPDVSLAFAVAASSAFPPVLSPAYLKVNPKAYTPKSAANLQKPPFTTKVVLTDGGVYDNLGLETAWKRYKTILVSDAGGKMEPESKPKGDWARHSLRILNLIDNQVRSLRKRQVIGSYEDGTRTGAFWDIRMDIGEFDTMNKLPCPADRTRKLAEIPTRLKRIPDDMQKKLINWGYSICDAVVRTYYKKSLPAPKNFPYEEAGV